MTNPNISSPENIKQHKPRPMIDLLVSIIIPSIILMKFSDENTLGVTAGLVLALAFPLGWGLYERFKYKKTNFIAVLGLISILLTGGIGLMELDPQWLAVKEAAIPAIIGAAVLISTRTRFPLIKTMLFRPEVFNIDKVTEKLQERDNTDTFEQRVLYSTYFLAGTFFFSAAMNYILAKLIVTSPAGTSAFNEELGRLTLISYPVIAIPSMIMMFGVFYYLWRTIRNMTGLRLEEILITEDKN